MEQITVHSQLEYDAIPKNFKGLVVIENSIERVRITGNSSVVAKENSSVEAWGNSSVEAKGNSSVVARENSSVKARGNSSVVARENSSVKAWGNSSVEAWGNSSVEAWGNSSVKAWGNSSVVAKENSSVEAWGNSSVKARGNSSVEARGNSSVVARENSSVVARENSSVEAWGNSSGKAFDNSRILCYGTQKFTKHMNAIIQKYKDPVYTKKIFIEIASQENGKIILYKSVNPDTFCDFRTGTIKYEIGKMIECPDFDPDKDRECGGGLHLSYTARKTQNFNRGTILKCLVDPDDIVVYKGNIEKVRCRKVFPVAVVNIKGETIK